MAVLIGAKIGQKHESSAICVAENPERGCEYHFVVRYLERLVAGTAFPDVADRIASIARRASSKSRHHKKLFVDATGLGEPILDLVKSRVSLSTVLPVYFNYGDRRDADWKEVKLGKAYLVSRLQMLLQCGRLHLPRTDEAEVLTQELLDYDIRVEKDANEHYGAFQVGTHDDLVTALGLAVQDDGAPTWSIMSAW